MFYLNGNEQDLSPGADYWRARAEELERQLTEARRLLMQMVSLLPAEYLDELQLDLVQINAAEFYGHHAAARSESLGRAE